MFVCILSFWKQMEEGSSDKILSTFVSPTTHFRSVDKYRNTLYKSNGWLEFSLLLRTYWCTNNVEARNKNQSTYTINRQWTKLRQMGQFLQVVLGSKHPTYWSYEKRSKGFLTFMVLFLLLLTAFSTGSCCSCTSEVIAGSFSTSSAGMAGIAGELFIKQKDMKERKRHLLWSSLKCRKVTKLKFLYR